MRTSAAMNDVDLAVPWDRMTAELRRYIRRRVSDSHTADDLVQEVLTRMAAHLRERSPSGPLHAWMMTIARNAVVDHYRARASTTKADEPDEEPAQRESGPDRTCLLASFRAFVHALPPEQREAVLLTEYDGMTQRAVAERLGVPLSTVKSRVQRGRKRLERALHDCCVFEFDRRGHVVDWQRRPGGDCRDC